jgi:hypothetical protein
MNFSEHARAGITASLAVSLAGFIYYNDIAKVVPVGLAAFLGSVFPDLDTTSKPSVWAARMGLVFSLICLAINKPYPAALVGMLFFLVKSEPHRGFLHKYAFIALFFAYGAIQLNPVSLAFGAGLIVHFWLDKLSPLAWKNWI